MKRLTLITILYMSLYSTHITPMGFSQLVAKQPPFTKLASVCRHTASSLINTPKSLCSYMSAHKITSSLTIASTLLMALPQTRQGITHLLRWNARHSCALLGTLFISPSLVRLGKILGGEYGNDHIWNTPILLHNRVKLYPDLTQAFTQAGANSCQNIKDIVINSLGVDKRSSKKIGASFFFEEIIGTDEECLKQALEQNKLPETLKIEDSPTGIILKETKNRYVAGGLRKTTTRFAAGKFQEFNLADLRKQTANVSKKAGSFSVVMFSQELSSINPNGVAKLDTGAMQANPSNKNAAFGVASNFNALEAMGPNDKVEETPITGYYRDRTQGPAAVTSALPGTIYRKYLLYRKKTSAGNTWMQTEKHQINLLEGLGINLINGYPVADSDRNKNPLALSEKILPNDGSSFKIGWHSGIQVTGGFRPLSGPIEYIEDPTQIIDQVFAAAIPLDYYGWYDKTEELERAAQKILDWTIEAILRAAYAQGKQKVILPLFGCGVFNNSPVWIANSFIKMKQFIIDSGMTVILNGFTLGTDQRPQFKESVPLFKNLVHETRGVVLLVGPDGEVSEDKGV